MFNRGVKRKLKYKYFLFVDFFSLFIIYHTNVFLYTIIITADFKINIKTYH